MLMSPKGLENIVMPNILVSLQRSVVSVMVGKLESPDHMTHGVTKSSSLDSFEVRLKSGGDKGLSVHSLASTGGFIFMQTSKGLYKIGSGYSGTIKGHVYNHKPDFESSPGWLGCAQGSLFFKLRDGQTSMPICKVDQQSMDITEVYPIKNDEKLHERPHLMFSDGTNLGYVTVEKDNFVMKVLTTMGPNYFYCDREMPLKLARKCVDLFGASVFKEGETHHSLDFGCEEDALDVRTGKDFALMLSSQNKLYYSGTLVQYLY